MFSHIILTFMPSHYDISEAIETNYCACLILASTLDLHLAIFDLEAPLYSTIVNHSIPLTSQAR